MFCAKKRDFLTAGASACRQSLWIHICTVPYSIKIYKSRADYKQQKQNAWLFMVPRNICPFMYMYRNRYKHVIKISMWGNIFIVTLTLLVFQRLKLQFLYCEWICLAWLEKCFEIMMKFDKKEVLLACMLGLKGKCLGNP